MIEILSARYGLVGSSSDKMDVTEKIKKLLSSDGQTLVLMVSSSSIGVTDPSPSNPKELNVTYSVDGTERSETIPDASTLIIKSQEPAPVNSVWFAISSVGNLWYQALFIVAVFLYIMSVAFAFEFGRTLFNPLLWIVIALLLPYVSFWAIPVIIILLRLFSSQDFILLRGARR